ncbi:hypothetical protein AB6M99_06705 [Streptococcus hillyeri]
MAKEALINQTIYWFLILLKLLILILDEYKSQVVDVLDKLYQ